MGIEFVFPFTGYWEELILKFIPFVFDKHFEVIYWNQVFILFNFFYQMQNHNGSYSWFDVTGDQRQTFQPGPYNKMTLVLLSNDVLCL